MPSTTVNNLTTLTATVPRLARRARPSPQARSTECSRGQRSTRAARSPSPYTDHRPPRRTIVQTAARPSAPLQSPAPASTPRARSSHQQPRQLLVVCELQRRQRRPGLDQHLRQRNAINHGQRRDHQPDGERPASGTAGTQITDPSISASLTGGAGATGTITFTVFGPQTNAPADCSNGGTVVDITNVSGNGTYAPRPATHQRPPATTGGMRTTTATATTTRLPQVAGRHAIDTVNNLTTLTATGPSSSETARIADSISLASRQRSTRRTITFTVYGPQANAPTECSNGGTPSAPLQSPAPASTTRAQASHQRWPAAIGGMRTTAATATTWRRPAPATAECQQPRSAPRGPT